MRNSLEDTAGNNLSAYDSIDMFRELERRYRGLIHQQGMISRLIEQGLLFFYHCADCGWHLYGVKSNLPLERSTSIWLEEVSAHIKEKHSS